MDSKKHSKADIERQRGLFFLIGLTIVLGLVSYAFQYTSVKHTPKLPKPEEHTSHIFDLVIPRTNHPEPEKARKESGKVDVTKKPVFKPDPKDDNSAEDPKKLNPNLGTEVGSEPDPELGNTEPVPVIVVERIARPQECDEYNSREEQMECLNRWINKYIRKNVNYPELARQLNVEERIYVELVFDEMGALESAQIIRGANQALREEALRVFEDLPPFLPASQQGVPVKMSMKLPVNFKLR